MFILPNALHFFSYLTISLRNLRKHNGHAFISIFGLVIGLAIGLTASLLNLQFVQFGLSYGRFHEDGDRIDRVRYDSYSQGERLFNPATAFPRVGPAMKAEFPEVEDVARLFLRYGGGVVRCYRDSSFKEDNLFQADQSFLQQPADVCLRHLAHDGKRLAHGQLSIHESRAGQSGDLTPV